LQHRATEGDRTLCDLVRFERRVGELVDAAVVHPVDDASAAFLEDFEVDRSDAGIGEDFLEPLERIAAQRMNVIVETYHDVAGGRRKAEIASRSPEIAR